MIRKLVLLLLPFLFAGCAQNIRMAEIGNKDVVPTITYEAYFFVTGDSERSRAALLIDPEAKVGVVPECDEITTTTATYSDAMYFMKAKRGMRDIYTQKVFYKEKYIGYLITYAPDRLNRIYEMTVKVYDKDEKIYFSGSEKIRVED